MDLQEFLNRNGYQAAVHHTLHGAGKPNRASKQDGEEHDSSEHEHIGVHWLDINRFLPKAGSHDYRGPCTVRKP